MTDIIIRHCEPEDARDLQVIYGQTTSYAGTLQLPFPSLVFWKRRLESKPEGVYSLVAEINGGVVGQIGVHICASPRRRHAAEIGMAVHEDFRGQRLGSRLLASAIELGEGWLGLERLELSVFADNVPAKALYEKHGFVAEGVARDYALRDGAYADVVLMARVRRRQVDASG